VVTNCLLVPDHSQLEMYPNIWQFGLHSRFHLNTFFNLPSFIGRAALMSTQYKTSLLTESQAVLKSKHSLCTAPHHSQFFSGMWWMQNIWSVVDLLCWNPHWWPPIISSTCGPNFDRRMLVKSLYVVDNSEITSTVITSYFITLLISMYNDFPLLRRFFSYSKHNKFMDFRYCHKSRG